MAIKLFYVHPTMLLLLFYWFWDETFMGKQSCSLNWAIKEVEVFNHMIDSVERISLTEWLLFYLKCWGSSAYIIKQWLNVLVNNVLLLLTRYILGVLTMHISSTRILQKVFFSQWDYVGYIAIPVASGKNFHVYEWLRQNYLLKLKNSYEVYPFWSW